MSIRPLTSILKFIFKDQAVREGGQPNPLKWDRQVAPKRQFQTTSRRVVTQKTEEFTQRRRKPSRKFMIHNFTSREKFPVI